MNFCNLLHALVEFLFLPVLHSTTKEMVEAASAWIGTLPGKVRTHTFQISLTSFKINRVFDDNYNNNNMDKSVSWKSQHLVEKIAHASVSTWRKVLSSFTSSYTLYTKRIYISFPNLLNGLSWNLLQVFSIKVPGSYQSTINTGSLNHSTWISESIGQILKRTERTKYYHIIYLFY
jgi:hypothetical protein